MIEKEFENIIIRYPELIEDGLSFKGRQVNVKGKFIDILFEDRHGQKLILELKIGTILRKHVGQLMDYEGYILSPDDPTLRVMLIGNRVPNNLRRSLDHHGFEWKEITELSLINFLKQKNDIEYLTYFSQEKVELSQRKMSLNKPHIVISSNRKMTIVEKMIKSFGSNHIGKIFSRQEIIDIFLETYPGTNRTSVIPSDYCYNRTNKGINFENHLFEHLGSARYKVLGANYDYEGPILWKGDKVGEWRKGEKRPHLLILG